jgi:DHA1 family inner membrane transport protein
MTDMTEPAGGFSRAAIIATVLLGAGVGCINALQPILLGAMLATGRISVGQIGQAATAEAAGMAIAITAAAMFVAPARLRLLARFALIAMLAANCLTPLAQGPVVLGLRVVNGAGTGLLFWILIGMIGRAASPARLFAIYITVQSVGSLLLSLLLTDIVVPHFGPAGGYGALAAIDFALLAAATTIPSAYGATSAGRRGLPPVRGWLALLGVGSLLAGIISFWVYIVPLLHELGYSDDDAHRVIPIAIGFQIAGGLIAAFCAERVRPILACLGGAAICIAAILAILASHDLLVVAAAMAAFAICWMAVPPFQVPLLIEVDPSLRSALLIGSAQLFGLALGPVIASAFMADDRVGPIAWAAIGFITISLLANILAVAGLRRPPAPIPLEPLEFPS